MKKKENDQRRQKLPLKREEAKYTRELFRELVKKRVIHPTPFFASHSLARSKAQGQFLKIVRNDKRPL